MKNQNDEIIKAFGEIISQESSEWKKFISEKVEELKTAMVSLEIELDELRSTIGGKKGYEK